MNRVKNKIMSAAAVVCIINIVLCLMLPLFEVIASAEGTTSTGVGNPIKTYYETFDPTVYSERTGTYLDSSKAKENYFCCRFGDYNYYVPFEDFKNSFMPFVAHYGINYGTTDVNVLTAENLYYIIFTRGTTPKTYRHLAFVSESPIVLKEGDDGYVYFHSETIIVSKETCISFKDSYYQIGLYYHAFYNNSSASTSSYSEKCNLKFSASTTSLKNNLYSAVPNSTEFSEITWEEMYTNCKGIINKAVLPNLKDGFIPQLGVDPTLSDQIDVKLTPEFGLNMSREYDSVTGQKDYFKFEVTNNSEKTVQFCLSIKEKSVDIEKAYDGQIVDGVFEGVGDWENAKWNYITDTYYYSDSVKQIKTIFDSFEDFMNRFALSDVDYLPEDYMRYAELQKGNFYWMILKPGETYGDYVYWNNVNISEGKSYSFICDAVPTLLDYPTDIFYYNETGFDELSPTYYAPNDDMPTTSYHLDIRNTLSGYSVNANDCYRVCNYVFSTYTMPTFSNTVTGGKSAITSGWNDTQAQSSNPYYIQNLITNEIVPVGDYMEYAGNMPSVDVDLDLDNLGIDDVKQYLTYSQGFFDILKIGLGVFPPFVWVIICFGLTAVIVVGIIKILK